MRSISPALMFHQGKSLALFDQHARLIHDRLYSQALIPVESQQLLREGVVFKHKGDADFGVVISHDVDHIYSENQLAVPRHQGGILSACRVLSYELKQKFRGGNVVIRERERNFDIRTMLDWELKNNIPASYYFLSLQKGDQDFNYECGEILDILKGVLQSNGEVGLHGGHESTRNMDVLLAEKKNLESSFGLKINGFRSHYLKWSPGETEGFVEAANFLYDTSWGSAQQPGFVKGFSTPHPVWNVTSDTYCKWVEIPLIAMDCSFFDYMKLSIESAWELFLLLVKSVKETNGVLTILWHNSYYKHLPFYWKMLEYLQTQNVHFGTSAEFAQQALDSGYIDQVKQYYDR